MKRRDWLTHIAMGCTSLFSLARAQSRETMRGSTARTSAAEVPAASLTFGLITPRNPELTLRNWSPFLDRLALAIQMPVERRTYAAQGELVRDFLDGRLDLGWMGNAPALNIVEAGRGSIFAAMVVQGKTAYRSVLIAHRDSPLRNLDDVHRNAAKLVFGDGDIKSTSGHIVPKYFAFARRGVNEPEKIFRSIRRSSHEANALAVIRREVDVATNNMSELENIRSAYRDEASAIRVLWESPDIPESPLVWRNDLPASVKRRVEAFVTGFGTRDAAEKDILWNINKLTAFRKSTNRQLVTIADVEMFTARQAILLNTDLSAAERAERVDQVTRRASRLELLIKSSA